LVEQEGRILLAIQAIEKGDVLSIRRAAHYFNVPYTTLHQRLRRTPNRVDIRANSHKLTQIEEESLIKWIISIDDRGGALRPSIVREIANLLLSKRGSTPIYTVGHNWVRKFIQRHPDRLRLRFSRRYSYKRAK